jgi:hypothetical protein
MRPAAQNKRLYRRPRTWQGSSRTPEVIQGPEIQQQVPINIFMGGRLRSKLERP